MNVFISYSAKDTSLIQKIANELRHGVGVSEVHWWEDSKRLGKEAWPQIFGWLDKADLVLVVVTGNVLSRAMAVGNEVGYAKAKGKIIIPLVCEPTGLKGVLQKMGLKVGIQVDDLGCFGELVHDRINGKNPGIGLEKIKKELGQLMLERQQANEAAEKTKIILAVLAAVGGAFVLAAN